MGEFLNPDSMAYKRAKNSEIYVDTISLLKLLNKRINTMNNRVCSTKPRGFASSDDVLTALVHLGYLAYDEEECQVYIPNKEVRAEFEKWSKEL